MEAPEKWYDLIFMDIQMPIMNGYEATAAIRALTGSRGKVPIIAMTANAFAEDVQLAKNTGMNEHIAKPLDLNKCSESNRIETSVLPAGHHYIPVELDEVVFFMRKGHLLPLAKDGKKIQSVADVDFADLRLLAYAPDGASYEYYTDDGETRDYDKPEHFVHITMDADGNAKSDRATVKVEG